MSNKKPCKFCRVKMVRLDHNDTDATATLNLSKGDIKK
jgi:hypothetical protein